jgi:hypothetical protein
MAIFVNIDDVGISPGCNAAAVQSCVEGKANSISYFANGDYLDDALRKTMDLVNVEFGVHLTLTYGRALSGKSSIAPDGVFNKSYPTLLFKSIFSDAFRNEVKIEFECQIRHLIARGLRLSHIDSHRHVHMIPAIFTITAKLAEKYKIERIRVSSDEKFFFSIFRHGWPFKLTFSGLAKFAIIKFFGLFLKKSYKNSSRFFSLLFTGAINSKFLNNICEHPENAEVAIHPGLPELDTDTTFYNILEKKYWLSEDRSIELDVCIASTDESREKNE